MTGTQRASDDFALPDDFALAAEAAPALAPILEAIDRAGGRITFAEFMGLALGHPEHGYYSRPDLRWGRDGDYETSPEVHPIFGYLWARQVLECWERLDRPREFALVEPGAGSGALMTAMLTWLRARAPQCFEAVRPVVLDGHPRRIEKQRTRLTAAGFAAEHALFDDWIDGTHVTNGVVISNEYFDALPVHLAVRREGSLREWYVARAGVALHLVEDEASTPALAEYFTHLGLEPGEGCRAEVGLAAFAAMRRLAARVDRGYVLTIDYGYSARDLYASWRREGTLMAFRAHSPQPDPLALPGRTDLTCHVDFTSLAAAARDGWFAAPLTSQAEALTALGLPDALRAAAQRAHLDAQRYASDRRAAETLTDPAGLGRIRVMAMARSAPLEGLRCLTPLAAPVRQ